MKRSCLMAAILFAFVITANAQAKQAATAKKADSAKTEVTKFTPPKIVKDPAPPPAPKPPAAHVAPPPPPAPPKIVQDAPPAPHQ